MGSQILNLRSNPGPRSENTKSQSPENSPFLISLITIPSFLQCVLHTTDRILSPLFMHGKQHPLPMGSSTQPGMWQSIHWTCHVMPTQPDFISLCSLADQMQKPGLEEGSVECRKGRLNVSFATYQLSNLRVWYHSGISVYWKLGISAYCLHLAGDLKKLLSAKPI